ncbi:MAG TPA: hypothetical protein VHY30_01590 [Verrucomicrobiae bacterium]|jgi:hypothetical protein|nr:hypothetical protein [Verrucomicrobiae bacterium]
MSWEQLELMAGAHGRLRAKETLRLAQLLVAGQCDASTWRKKQTELIEEMQNE